MSLEPAVQSRARISLILGLAIDVIDGQELYVVIAAARARRFAIAVMHQCGHAIALLSASILFSFGFWILPHELPARKYLTPLACPLKAMCVG